LSNETHVSTSDPDARLYKKAANQSAKLCHMGHLVMENRHGLVVDAKVTLATGAAEREAAVAMVKAAAAPDGITLGGDKGYDDADFVAEMQRLGVVPHVARNTSNGRKSAIADKTAEEPGYRSSIVIRKRIEEAFGWMKTIGMLRKTRHRGTARVGWMFTLVATAYDLIRLPKLLKPAV
jgi:IS5 family transposase